MKTFKVIVLVFLCAFFTRNTYSQSNLSFHFGPSLPVSGFASDDLNDEEAGGAAVGVNIGLKYVYPLTESGLGIFGGIDFNYNGLKKDVRDDYEEAFNEMTMSDFDIKFSKYINVPVTAGLNYTYLADDKIGVFVNAGLALNFLKITNMEVEMSGQKAITEMDIANSVGFKIGGGILINPQTSISVDYLNLGNHDINGKASGFGLSEDMDGELEVKLMTLTVGIKF